MSAEDLARLKSCPFCAGAVLELGTDSREGPLGVPTTPLSFWIQCRAHHCRARGPRAGTATLAALDWDNRR